MNQKRISMERLKKILEFIRVQIKAYWKLSIIACTIILALFIWREVRIMTVRKKIASINKEQTKTIPATRGNIYDCNGNIIATNKEVHDIFIDCCVMTDPEMWKTFSRKLAQELAQILPEKTAPQWWEDFQTARKRNNRYLPIIKGTTQEMIDSIMNSTLLKDRYKSGIIHIPRKVREYPYGNIARRTIGSWNKGTDTYLFGIENSFHDKLSGEDGFVVSRYNYKKTLKKVIVNSAAMTNGYHVHTTLDMVKQSIADSVLRATVENHDEIAGGCLAVMEVKTGRIKALVNMHKTDRGVVGEYLNYALDYAYEPGAVARPIALAAALSDGVIKSVEDEINIGEKYSGCEDYFYEWYKSLCINKQYFDIKEMRDIYLASSYRDDSNTVNAMCDGFEFTVCPMQLLVFYNTIANDGKMMRPMMIDSLVHDTYPTDSRFPFDLRERAIRKEVVDSLKKALTLNADGLIGKTGIAQMLLEPEARDYKTSNPYIDTLGRKKYAITFAGYYPQEKAQYSVICALFTKPTYNQPSQSHLPTDVVKIFTKELLCDLKP